ncbi:MAG TPA: peptidylprolyl isomerase [Gemmatimonadaceae bacterium]|nr:peptidylprolyl isomerase [Gemmatimonadaceae bacterium]
MKTLPAVLAALLAGGAPVMLAAQQPEQPAAAAGQEIPVDRIVAVAGREPILLTDIEERMALVAAEMRARQQPMPQDSAALAAMRQQLLATMINEELLLQRAHDLKIEVTDADVQQSVDRYMERVRQGYKSEDELLADLRRSGYGSIEEFRRWYTDQEKRRTLQQKLIQQLKQDGKLPPAPVSDADISEYFEKNRSQIPHMPATVSFRQIIIAPRPSAEARERTRAKAESLLAEIRRGGDFAQIAKRESEDPGSKELGGDLGWRRRGEFVPEFERMMLSLAPGQVSPVFQSSFGFHIMRLDRVQTGEFKVRHILLRPKLDSADVERARLEADSVVAALRRGASFDSLAARHGDPSEERTIPEVPRSQLPESYQKAIEGKQAHDIVGPFAIDDQARGAAKMVVLQLTSVQDEHEPTLAEYREQIRQQLQQERAMTRLIENLRKESYVSVRM